MFKRIDHVEIIPRDFSRAMEFYTDVLGFTVKMREPVGRPPLEEVAFFQLGDTMVELLSVSESVPVPAGPWNAGYRMMALEVEDMDRALEYLKTKGIGPSRGPVSLGKSRRAEIKDPDGLSIELRQW